MATVATGTDSGGAYRLTAARRLLVVVLGAMAVGSQWLAAPAYVQASTPHKSEVRFPATGEEQVFTEFFDSGSHPWSGCGGSEGGGMTYYSTGGSGGGGYVGKGGSGLDMNRICGFSPVPGDTYRFHFHSLDKGGASTVYHRLRFTDAANNSISTITSTAVTGNQPDDVWQAFDWTVTIPAGTVFVKWGVDGSHGLGLDTLAIFGTVPGGDCIGQAGAGTDGQLVWGSAALTSPSGAVQWGHQWLSSQEGCMFADAEQYRFVPSGGFTEGDTHSIAVQAWSVGNSRQCQIVIAWERTGSGGGSSVTAVNFKTTSSTPVDAVGAYFAEDVDEPPGVSAITIHVSKWCVLGALLISNVEGDPILDTDGNPWTDGGEAPATGADYWGDCEMPADAFDVWGWLKWIGCILLGGFQYLADLLGEVVASLGAAFGDVILPGLDGIAGAIGGAIGGILEYLFVPTTLGDAWQDFTDDAATRVPFGWFAQISSAVSGSLAAGSSGFEDMTLTIAGSSVNVGFASALTGVAPYRGLILAGAALIMTLGCLRWIMAAVGAAPGGSASGEAD